MQKRVVGLLSISRLREIDKPDGRIKIVRKYYGSTIGHVNLYFIQKQCRPSRAGLEASRLEFL